MAFAEPVAGVWDLACKPVAGEAQLGCVASTAVVSAKTGEQLLRVEVIPAGTLGNANAALRLRLPHGIALNASVGVQIDGGELFKIPLKSSSVEGLLAYQFIGSDLVEAMRSGQSMAVTVVTLDGETLTNAASLAGLTLVLDSAARMASPVVPPASDPAE